MPVIHCIGDARKIAIVADYDIAPLSHLSLLPGSEKIGCARRLSAQYYAFEFISKRNTNDSGVFFCGDHCAKQFLAKIGLPPLPLFNPLTAPSADNGVAVSTPGSAGNVSRMDPLNQEIYNAIHLIYTLTAGTPRGGMLATLDFVRSNPTRRTNDQSVVRVNRYALSCGFPQTLVTMVAAIPRARRFSFPEISNVLTAYPAETNVIA